MRSILTENKVSLNILIINIYINTYKNNIILKKTKTKLFTIDLKPLTLIYYMILASTIQLYY